MYQMFVLIRDICDAIHSSLKQCGTCGRFFEPLYKHHSLPNYVKNIRDLGTLDSFSTEPVSIIEMILTSIIPADIYNLRSQSLSIGGQNVVMFVLVARNMCDSWPV